MICSRKLGLQLSSISIIYQQNARDMFLMIKFKYRCMQGVNYIRLKVLRGGIEDFLKNS